MNKLFTLFVMFALFSCSEGKKAFTEEEKKDIARMIGELHAIKEMTGVYPYFQRDSVSHVLMGKFYQIHDMDSLRLADLFSDLRRDPALLKELHDMAIEDIEILMLQYAY